MKDEKGEFFFNNREKRIKTDTASKNRELLNGKKL